MNLVKHQEYFDPIDIHDAVHIIGVGATGSHVAELLARLGFINIHIYDFDVVEDVNIANQMYYDNNIGKPKTTATADHILSINPAIELKVHGEYIKQPLAGYVFICADSIEVRRNIVQNNLYNYNIKAAFDFRIRLSDAQHYAADWKCEKQKKSLLDSMDFTEEEAAEQTPVGVCGTTLSIIPTIKIIVSAGVANLINFIKEGILKSVILIDAFQFTMDAMGTNKKEEL